MSPLLGAHATDSLNHYRRYDEAPIPIVGAGHWSWRLDGDQRLLCFLSRTNISLWTHTERFCRCTTQLRPGVFSFIPLVFTTECDPLSPPRPPTLRRGRLWRGNVSMRGAARMPLGRTVNAAQLWPYTKCSRLMQLIKL
jgi:hypothetical protein